MILCLSGHLGRGWHVDDLRRAADRSGRTLVARPWRDLTAVVAADPVIRCGDVNLADVTTAILRTMPPGSLEQVVFRMDAVARLSRQGVRVFNPPRAMEIAVDKYLCLARLKDAGLPVPETIVCQRFDDAVAAFEQLGGDVLVKPLFGSEGFGISRVTDAAAAERLFAMLDRMAGVMYVQRFIPPGGTDLRLFVLGDRVLTSMLRRSDGWRTNVTRGGEAERFTPDAAVRALAVRAAAACDARIAGVDILFDAAGAPYVLEVNAAPGWRALSAVTGIDVAAAVLDDLESAHV